MTTLVRVVIPGTGILLESLPFVPAGEIAPICAIDRPFIEVGPVDVLAKFPRQHDVGVEVQDPLLAADLVEPAARIMRALLNGPSRR